MKKLLAILLIFLIIILGAVFTLFKSNTLLNYGAKKFLSEQNVTYDSLEGDILSGLKLKNINYNDKIKTDAAIEIDFKALASKEIHIKNIELTNLEIDKEYLKELASTPSSKDVNESNESVKIPFKFIQIDKLKLNTKEIVYEPYKLNSLDLNATDIYFDFDKQMRGDINLLVDSNITQAKIDATMKGENFHAKATIEPNIKFISQYTKEQNITLTSTPHLEAQAKGNFHNINSDINITNLSATWQDYILKETNLNTNVKYNLDNSNIKAVINKSFFDTNIVKLNLKGDTKLNLDDINNTLFANIDADILGYDSTFSDQNLSIKKFPNLTLNASVNPENAKAIINLNGGDIRYNSYQIEPKNIDINTNLNLKTDELKADINSLINSNIASINLKADTKLNLDDINNTINANIKANIDGVNKSFSDKNLTIKKFPKITLDAKLNPKTLLSKIDLLGGEIIYGEYILKPQNINIDSNIDIKSKNLKADIKALIDSNVAKSDLNAKTSLNLNDINNTLNISLDSNTIAYEKFLKRFEIEAKKEPKITLHIKNTKEIINGNLSLDASLLYKKKSLIPKISNSNFSYNIKTQDLKAKLNADVSSSIAKLHSSTDLKVNIADINNTLVFDTSSNVTKLNIEPLNLDSLTPINLKAKGTLKKLKANLNSPKITLNASSQDLNKIMIDLDTKKLFIGKILNDETLKNSFIALKSNGTIDLKNLALNLTSKIKTMKFSDTTLSSNSFKLKYEGEKINLENLILKGKGFNLSADVKKDSSNIDAKLKNVAFDIKAIGKIEPLNMDANIEIHSLKKLKEQINKIYPVEMPELKGALKLIVHGGDRSTFSLSSKEVIFDKKHKLSNIKANGSYEKKKILIPTFEFDTSGFKNKKMNRKVALVRPGIINIGEDQKVDIEFNNLFSIKGAKQKNGTLDVKFKSKDLFWAYDGYGEGIINTDINYLKVNDFNTITGSIKLKDTLINYDSKTLSALSDEDIIFVEDLKDKKKKKESDSFKKNFFVDIDILSQNPLLYKTDDADIKMEPKLKLEKQFNEEAKIKGKVEIVKGFYDVEGKTFDILKSTVAFRGGKSINPLLDIHIMHELPEIKIFINISGDKNRPKIDFTSEPPKTKTDIISYLFLGISADDLASGNASKAASKALSNALSKHVGKDLGLDRLEVDQSDSGEVSMKAGKRINKDTMMYFKNSGQENSIIIEYEINRNWGIESELKSESTSADLFYEKKFK